MTKRRNSHADKRKPAERLADLQPREEAPEQQAEVKGGLEPPHGVRLTALPPYDPPDG